MANRFIRLIEDGSITTEGELKSAFRSHALATHPDLRDGEAFAARSPGEDFIKTRTEYEAALRYLAPKAAQAGDGPSAAFGRKRDRFDRALFYADLSALMKAGFPKTARHDAERRKYARLRLHVRSSLAALDGARTGSPLDMFDGFERSLARCKEEAAARASPWDAGTGTYERARQSEAVDGLLLDLIAYEECGIVPLRASIEIEIAGLRQESTDPDLLAFLDFLVGNMDGGTMIL